MKIKHALMLLANLAHFPISKRISNRKVHRKSILLDFNNLEGCDLKGCKLIYLGIGKISITNCNIEDSNFLFDGPAAKALLLLKTLGMLSPEIIMKTFPEIFEKN